jgi:hypothetical protein
VRGLGEGKWREKGKKECDGRGRETRVRKMKRKLG